MAERVGFEPTIPVRVYTRSRRAPSATRPPLRFGHNIQFSIGETGRTQASLEGLSLGPRLRFGPLNPLPSATKTTSGPPLHRQNIRDYRWLALKFSGVESQILL